jgi:hypothetical protein
MSNKCKTCKAETSQELANRTGKAVIVFNYDLPLESGRNYFCLVENFKNKPEVNYSNIRLITPCTDCKPAESVCKTYTIANDKRHCDLCTANNPYANQPSREELQRVISSQAAEIETNTEFIKGLKENNAELAKTIAALTVENKRLKKEVELLRYTEPNGVDDNGNPIQYRLSNEP